MQWQYNTFCPPFKVYGTALSSDTISDLAEPWGSIPASFVNSNHVLASGDAGGPLLLAESNGEAADGAPMLDFVVGVISFGPEVCPEIGAPIVYTRISYFKDWINDTTGISENQVMGPDLVSA